MANDTSPNDSCRIELIYSVESRVASASQQSPISIVDRLAKVQAIIEQAIAEEFRADSELVSADVRFRSADSLSISRRRRKLTSGSKKDIILKLLDSKEGVTSQGLQEATGWKPSTVSAQLDYLSKTGHTINRSKDDGVLRYRLV